MKQSAILMALVAMPFFLSSALAMAPIPRPTAAAEVENGRAAPFAGSWSVTWPSRDIEIGDQVLAICTLPVRIQAANDTHIFYLSPREIEPDTTHELVARDGGTAWEPMDGGPLFLAIWTGRDSFYLYQDGAVDGDMPYIYVRCP